MWKNKFLGGRIFLYLVVLFFFSVTFLQAEDIKFFRQLSDTFSEISEKVKPSVVSVVAVTKIKVPFRSFSPFDDPFFDDLRRFFGPDLFPHFPESPREREYRQRGVGSGVIVAETGYILTNNHVVKNAEEIKVILSDGRKFEAEIKGRDPKTDLAVIKIKAKNLPAATLGDSDEVKVGEWVLAIGNPFGLQHTVTAGIVSATGRANIGIAQYEDFIQTDAAINPGNSGGPLVNLDGEVIGINTAIFSQSGGYMGVGFAIPVNMARQVMDQLIEYGKVTRGWLGVTIQNLDKDMAASFGLKEEKGILVGDVIKRSPAEKAGIKRGDIILQFNNKEVESVTELQQMVAGTKVGSKVPVKIYRENKEMTLKVKIGEMPEDIASLPTTDAEKEFEEKLGIEVRELTPEIAKKYGYEEDKGVLIVKVIPGSPAEWAGLQRGDLLLQIGTMDINNMDDYRGALKEVSDKENIRLLVKSGKYTHYVMLSLR